MITRILYTYSWDGYVVEDEKGNRQTTSASQLLKEYGEEEFSRLNKIAHQWPTGCFHKV